MRAAIAAVLLIAAFETGASASAPHTARVVADTLTAMPAAGVDKPLRTYRDVASTAPATGAWTKFVAAAGNWEAMWDRATGVPLRMYGRGISAPGSIAQPQVAEAFARQWLADHLALLAPGSAPSDFVLVSNNYDGNIRALGFVQQAGGVPVVGGQISFEFKNDRLFVIGSTALPNVTVPAVRAHLDRKTLVARATVQLRAALELDAQATDNGGEVIIPLVGDTAVLGYRRAAPMTIDGGAAGRYLAYVDVASGAPIAVLQQNRYATGTVDYNEVNRYPNRGYTPAPAPHAFVQVAGGMVTTDDAGTVTWSPDGPTTVTTGVTGDFVTILNCAEDPKCPGAALATTMMAISPGGSALWDTSAVSLDDAQVQTYLSINIVKAFVRANLDPQLAILDMPLTARVNIDQSCNAFFDGTAVNFFHADKQCQNTGRIQDVVFHEFGHDVHQNEIIMGVGAFDGAMSEGAADFLAVNVTGDPEMGKGFFFDDTPLRDLDPQGLNKEWQWPKDIGEIHHTGLIFGGTFWDLRKDAEAVYGADAGDALVRKLYLGALRRAVDIPSSLIAVLATDDDDGDLSNGTPNECMIRKEFARHGLTTVSGHADAPGAFDRNVLSAQVSVTATGLAANCNNEHVIGMQIIYNPGDTGEPAMGSVDGVPLVAGGPTYRATIPLALGGDVLYQPQVELSSGARLTLPDNLADPQYQLYSGATIPLYCTTFEDGDPLTMGWTTTTKDGSPSPWQWGVPTSGATDPPAAFSGTHALVQALNGDYPASEYSAVAMPPIDVGHYSDVRLQYRRWLASEDSHFDQARITANGNEAWLNASSNMGDSSALQHIDKEWRFQDVPLSGHFSGHTLTVGWELTSDPGLELGGWALDDVCVVANPASICGDGIQSRTEQCDDGGGNADVADACRTDCTKPKCGDGIVDTGEDCDGGSDCSPTCSFALPGDGGCCSVGGDPAGPLALTAMVGVLICRRRRAA